MILADKILALRKQHGWSQEELAEKLNVSRQSVSKWEGALSIPDLGKILEMANLFGVTTDYLIKDELEHIDPTAEAAPSGKRVSLPEALDFLSKTVTQAKRVSLGVLLCILSPSLLIVLVGMSEDPAFRIPESLASALGIAVMFTLIACGTALFLISDKAMQPFRHFKTGEFDLEYGVSGIVREKFNAYQQTHTRSLVAGVILCIVCALPLIITACLGAPDIVLCALSSMLLVCVACGVLLLVRSTTRQEGFQQLLQEGEFHPSKREARAKEDKLGAIFWPIATGVYLLLSFLTGAWHLTWVLWPVAALVFAGICAALRKAEID